jgi:hypothetical protein
MNTTDKNNSTFPRDPGNPNSSDRNTVMNEELYDLNTRETQNSRAEDAERGYTVRNGHNPNKPNPDQESAVYDDDLDDLDDDFHKDRDLEDNTDQIYEVVLEDENDLDDEDEDEYIEEDLDEEVENDEFDNPADTFENDFNETEEDLEDIDDEEDFDDEEESEYIEDDVQEENDDDYIEEDKRRF